MSTSNRPARHVVERIAQEEATWAGLSLIELLAGSGRRSVEARRRTLRRVKAVTGCSTYGLAAVFGCDHGAVLDALRAPGRFRSAGPDAPPLGAALTTLSAIDELRRRRPS